VQRAKSKEQRVKSKESRVKSREEEEDNGKHRNKRASKAFHRGKQQTPAAIRTGREGEGGEGGEGEGKGSNGDEEAAGGDPLCRQSHCLCCSSS